MDILKKILIYNKYVYHFIKFFLDITRFILSFIKNPIRKTKSILYFYNLFPKLTFINKIYYPLVPNNYCSELLFLDKKYEPGNIKIVEEYLKKDDYFFDIGSDCGYFSFYAHRILNNTGKIISCNPLTIYNDIYDIGITKNHINNLVFHNVAFGNSIKNNFFYVNKKQLAASFVSDQDISNIKEYQSNAQDFQKTTVNLITFEKFIKEHNYNKIDFIKMDIEGSEFEFLMGTNNLINIYKPHILMEWNKVRIKRNYNKIMSLFKQYTIDYYFYSIDHRTNSSNYKKLINLDDLQDLNTHLFLESKKEYNNFWI